MQFSSTSPKRSFAVWMLGVLSLLAGVVVVSGWTGAGRIATGTRRARMEQSPQWREGHFVNPQPIINDYWATLTGMFNTSDHTSPTGPVHVEHVNPSRFAKPPPTGLRATWFGHSSMLIEIDGHRVLTDPIWGERSSPISWLGPKRWYAPLIALSELPAIDAVIISHDHYDHLDHATIIAMKDWSSLFIVPLGLGAHLESWGIRPEQIVELDWWEHAEIGDLKIVCTPARHASGRMLIDNDGTLWASYAILGAQHRAYFSGDTGLFPAMGEIGERFGPFDLTMIEVGQYDGAWPDWHIGPEQAVRAHRMLNGRVMFPIHWGLLALAFHGWTEPVERSLAAAESSQVTIVTPKPGQSIEPESPQPNERWWPNVPWRTAQEAPVVSSQVDAN